MTANSEGIGDLFRDEFAEQFAVATRTRDETALAFQKILDACLSCIAGGGKILFFGNGGSASQAQHLAAELVIRYRQNRAAIAAIALTTDTSILTAGGNDLGFEQIFARQIAALGRPGDLAFGFSTSGRSPNVNLALKLALSRGLAITGFAGGDGGEMAKIVPNLLIVPSTTTARIQEMHLLLGHMLCIGLERELKLV